MLQQVLDGRRRMYGVHHQTVAVALNNMALPEFSHGQFEKAEQHLREAIDIWSETKGLDNPDTLAGVKSLAAVERAQDKFADAEDLNKQALALIRKHYPEASEAVASALNQLGRTQKLEGKYDEAIANFNAAIVDLHAANLDTTSTESVLAPQSIAEVELLRNRPAVAKEILLKIDPVSSKMYTDASHHRADIWLPLGRANHLLGDDVEAEKLLRRALVVRTPIYHMPSLWIAEVQLALAEALNAQHKRDEAKSLAEQSAEQLRPMKTNVAKGMLARAEIVIANK